MLYLFTYLFLAVLGLRCCIGFSPVAVSGGYSPLVVHGPLNVVASCCRVQALERLGFSICLSLLGLSVQAQWLWLMGLVVPQHVGSSWTRV